MNTNKQAFQEILTKILKHSGFPITNKIEIRQQEYNQFWEYLKQPENAVQFMFELMKQVEQIEHQKRNKNYNLENLLATLLTLCIFFRIDHDKKRRELTEVRAQLELTLSQRKQKLTNPYSQSIITFLILLFFENDENQFLSFIIGSIAFLPDLSKIQKPESIESSYDFFKQHYQLVETFSKSVRVKNDQFYNFLLDERFDLTETGEFMFCYEYLHKYIKMKNRVVPRIVYDAILKFFKMIPFIAQDFPEQAEKSALSLLHMTKQLITFYSCDGTEYVKPILQQVEILRRWPFPVGVMANELVQILFQECKSKGSSFRMKIREEIPEVDFLEGGNQSQFQSLSQNQQSEDQSAQFQYPNSKNSINNFNYSQMQQQQQQIQNQNIEINQFNSSVLSKEKYILQVLTFADDKLNECSSVLQFSQDIIRQHLAVFYQKYYSSHALRIYMISQILAIEQKLTIERHQQIQNLSEQDIFNIYSKLLAILEKCDELDSIVDIKMIQENAFEEIMRDIMKLKRVDQDDILPDINSISNEQQFIPEFPLYFLKNVGNKPYLKLTQKNSEQKIDQYDLFGEASANMIKGFVRQAYEDPYLPLHTEPLRILIVGGDQEINAVCNILGNIYDGLERFEPTNEQSKRFKPHMIKNLDIRVYVVPSRECALAQFLAVKDPWYQRYLYLPFVEDILIPKIETIKDDGTKGKELPNIQPQMDRDNVKMSIMGQTLIEWKCLALNSYLREATRAYSVRVYKLEMYLQDEQEKKTIYFCSYVLFGAAAEFEYQKEKGQQDKEKIQKMTLYDYKEKNLCKFTYLDSKIKTESTDMLGNRKDDDLFSLQLHSGKINNVYTDFFEGNMPMPHTDWLELSYISFENSKLFDNGLKQKNIFKKHSKGKKISNYIYQYIESIQNAFNSLFTNLSITKITFEESSRKPFVIVVDGRIFPKVTKFEIKSTELDDKFKKYKKGKGPNKQYYDMDPVNYKSILHLNLPIMSFLPFKV